jgi:hypothetical protein
LEAKAIHNCQLTVQNEQDDERPTLEEVDWKQAGRLVAQDAERLLDSERDE